MQSRALPKSISNEMGAVMKDLLGRSRLAGFVLIIVAAMLLACGREVSEPAQAVMPLDAGAPTAAVTTSPPTATAVPETVPPRPTAIPTEIPTSTAAARTAPEQNGEGGSLVLLRSSSAGAPSRLGSGGIGGFSLSPAPQTMAEEGSLTVSAIGSVTVAADEAYVVVIPETGFGPSGPLQLSVEDRQEIVANLVAIGLTEEAVEFGNLVRYEPSSISVEVDIDEFATLGETIVEAVEEVVRRSESFGVRFSLSEENCDRAISAARREAVPAAEKAADDLSDALGLERGAIIGALEYPLQTVPYRLPGADLDPCTGQTAYPYGALLPFDSEPEVEVSVGLQVAYSIH